MTVLPAPVLVDARNWPVMKTALIDKMRAASLIGFDIESHDADAHAGLKKYRKGDSARVFDINRTTVCGFSLYFDGDDTRYYVNLAHADVENRIPWLEVKELLDAKPAEAVWLAHKAPFELTMMAKSLKYDLSANIICTMQLAVAAFDADEYPVEKLIGATLNGMHNLLVKQASHLFHNWELGSDMSAEQADLFYKIVAKESDSAHSYNGFVKEIAYGFSLKKLVLSLFGYKMTTFEECLRGKDHMGQLTGEEVAGYGSDDAYWCVRVFHWCLQHIFANKPKAWDAFINTENEMMKVYAEKWQEGLVINNDAVARRRGEERAECARVLRELKQLVKSFLPFAPEPHAKLKEMDVWYFDPKKGKEGYKSYRQRIQAWASLPDSADDYEQCIQASGSVPTPWAEERGRKGKLLGPNFTHYMMMRTLIYDLIGEEKLIIMEGKTQSDGDARGFLLRRFDNRIKEIEGSMGQAMYNDAIALAAIDKYKQKGALVACINKLAGIEQRMKLYLNPYTLLSDPETRRMYPEITSMLVTHRMAMANPNAMQLAKQGESTYVRGFFEPDEAEELMVSIDWKQIELVLIGEASGDPEFAKAYGQLPYQDLHLGAAADILSAIYDTEVTEEMFKALKKMDDDVVEPYGFPLVDNTGKVLTPKDAYKYNRGTAGGKGANFGYWYSGALASVALARGVGSDLMWRMTERYRERFRVAEDWRVNLIDFVKQNGYVENFDGTRRCRLEATAIWHKMMSDKFYAYGDPGIFKFGTACLNKIQRRAGNQAVNSLIQGGCGTLAKRSVLAINKEIKGAGFRARFKVPIHDELVFSVHHREIWDFLAMAKGVMTNHPDIVKNLKLDCSAAIGRTFEPYHETKAPYGQIELDEAPKIECLDPKREGQQLGRDEAKAVVEWLYRDQRRAA